MQDAKVQSAKLKALCVVKASTLACTRARHQNVWIILYLGLVNDRERHILSLGPSASTAGRVNPLAGTSIGQKIKWHVGGKTSASNDMHLAGRDLLFQRLRSETPQKSRWVHSLACTKAMNDVWPYYLHSIHQCMLNVHIEHAAQPCSSIMHIGDRPHSSTCSTSATGQSSCSIPQHLLAPCRLACCPRSSANISTDVYLRGVPQSCLQCDNGNSTGCKGLQLLLEPMR